MGNDTVWFHFFRLIFQLGQRHFRLRLCTRFNKHLQHHHKEKNVVFSFVLQGASKQRAKYPSVLSGNDFEISLKCDVLSDDRLQEDKTSDKLFERFNSGWICFWATQVAGSGASQQRSPRFRGSNVKLSLIAIVAIVGMCLLRQLEFSVATPR